MSKGGFGAITIYALELLDAQGQVITRLTNGNFDAISPKRAVNAKNAQIQGKNIVFSNMPGNAKLEIFDMNGNKIASADLQKSGSLAIDQLVHAKGNYIAQIKGEGIQKSLRIRR